VPVHSPETRRATRSDAEGYVRLELPRGEHHRGWNEVHLEIEGLPATRTGFPVLVPPREARLGVISDVDDTMMRTGAYSLWRNLWTTFTGSALTREVFADAVELVARLHDGANPVFYVSSSPWNLHHFLDAVFARVELVPGPMFLRDLGLTGARGHGDHKGAAIDAILAANPGLPFVLIGDTGQKDAFVYRDAIRRHPGRIERVILREPMVGAPQASRAAIGEIVAAGVPCHHVRDFSGVVP
jgi:phosphatidate phosphatase APP1